MMVGKRLLDTGLNTATQIVQDVISGQRVKKAAKLRTNTAGKSFLTGVLQDIPLQGRVRKLLKQKQKAYSSQFKTDQETENINCRVL